MAQQVFYIAGFTSHANLGFSFGSNFSTFITCSKAPANVCAMSSYAPCRILTAPPSESYSDPHLRGKGRAASP